MKRRNFIKSSALFSAGIFMPWQGISTIMTDQTDISEADKVKILNNYFNNIFNSQLDPGIIIPGNRYHFAESFEIELNKEKNSVFDFTDEIIDLGKDLNEDFSSLEKGVIPSNLTIGNGTLIIKSENGNVQVRKFSKLKTHDAKLNYCNHLQVLTYSPPKEWGSLKKLTQVSDGKYAIFEGKLKGKLFRVWKSNNHKHVLNISQYIPNVLIEEKRRISFQNLSVLRKYIEGDNCKTLNI